MRTLALPAAASFALVVAIADAQEAFTVRMVDRADLDYRALVSHQVSAPPFVDIAANRDPNDRTRYRAVVLRTEPHPSLVIEVILFRNEGCCSGVTAVRNVDLEAVATKLGIDGPGFTFEVLGAPSARRFLVQLDDRYLTLDLVDAQTVRVTPTQPRSP